VAEALQKRRPVQLPRLQIFDRGWEIDFRFRPHSHHQLTQRCSRPLLAHRPSQTALQAAHE
jgi:hypothetical protein